MENNRNNVYNDKLHVGVSNIEFAEPNGLTFNEMIFFERTEWYAFFQLCR